MSSSHTPPARPGLDRRSFLRSAACAAIGTTSLASSYWGLRSLGAAAVDNSDTVSAGDYRALVCIFLFGGNDGNNLLVPTDPADYANYAAARAGLALPPDTLLPITPATPDGRSYGLHPNVPEVRDLFAQKKLALVCNVGTLIEPVTKVQLNNHTALLPRSLMSHEDQQVEWQNLWPSGVDGTGWGGRMADLLHAANANAKVSMSVSLAGNNVFQNARMVAPFQMGVGAAPTIAGYDGKAPANSRLGAVINKLLALPHHSVFESAFAGITANAMATGQFINQALTGVTLKTVFPAKNSLAAQLQTVAQLIAVRAQFGLSRQTFFCSMGGFDTHSYELVNQGALLQQLSQALGAFSAATTELGVANQVTTFTASDFSRTFVANSGDGSDHAWGNHHLVMGDAVRGGDLYGRYPILGVNSPDDWFTGRWIPAVSVDQYSATLARWLGVSAGQLPIVLPNVGNFPTSDLGFMNA